jgi:hypothetical protein
MWIFADHPATDPESGTWCFFRDVTGIVRDAITRGPGTVAEGIK